MSASDLYEYDDACTRGPNAEVQKCLGLAAREWLDQHSEFVDHHLAERLGNRVPPCSTSGNAFVWAAERIYFATIGDLVEEQLERIAEDLAEQESDAVENGLRGPISPSLRWTIWERDDFTCKHCGVRHDLTVDHIVARSNGGTNDESNLQTLCRPCNSRKGTR